MRLTHKDEIFVLAILKQAVLLIPVLAWFPLVSPP